MKKSEEREVKMEKLVRRGGGGHSHGGGHGHFHGSGGSHHYGGHYGGESFWRSRGSHSSSSSRKNCENIVDIKKRQDCIESNSNANNLEIFFIFCAVIVFIFLKIKDFGKKY